MTTEAYASPRGYVHSALLYRSAQDYVDAVVPFVADGLDAGEPVMVVVPEDNLTLLRDALGDTAAEVTIADMAEVGRNPGRLLGVLGAFAAQYSDRRIRVLGEIVWPGRSADEYPACVQAEALSNSAFANSGATVQCAYNVDTLDEGVIADARATHPLLCQAGSTRRSVEYAPEAALAGCNQPLPSSRDAVRFAVRTLADLKDARSTATWYADRLGLSPDRIADLQLITTELATNSLQHTGGACRLAWWPRNGHLVCEARDHGRLADPLGGRPPGAGGGLSLVNAIADLVRTHTAPTGTTIQVYLRLDASREGVN